MPTLRGYRYHWFCRSRRTGSTPIFTFQFSSHRFVILVTYPCVDTHRGVAQIVSRVRRWRQLLHVSQAYNPFVWTAKFAPFLTERVRKGGPSEIIFLDYFGLVICQIWHPKNGSADVPLKQSSCRGSAHRDCTRHDGCIVSWHLIGLYFAQRKSKNHHIRQCPCLPNGGQSFETGCEEDDQ